MENPKETEGKLEWIVFFCRNSDIDTDFPTGLQLRKYENHSIDLPTLVQNLQYMKGITIQYFFGQKERSNS